MTVVGCDNDPNNGWADSALNGTWVSGNNELKLNNGNFEQFNNGTYVGKGIYTVSGNTVFFTADNGYKSSAEYSSNKLIFDTITYTRK